MTTVPECCSLFDSLQDPAFMDGLRDVTLIQENQIHIEKVADCEAVVTQSGETSPSDNHMRESGYSGEVADRMFCSSCQCPFESRDEQTEHYKLDWHRFNLKQRLVERLPVTVEEFERKTGAGDMSSISGSDCDSQDDSDADPSLQHMEESRSGKESAPEGDFLSGRAPFRSLFQNSQGQFLSVHHCVLYSKRLGSDGDLVASLLKISSKSVWVILMTGGGHFAGAVFQGKEILQHKTFHRYTVRAKRGTAQGLKDSQNRGHAPKSAGAALRRYNEAALVKDIQELLESWSEHLKEAAAIFLRAPSLNKGIFFGGREAPLEKNDPRVRTLPFPTRRATFREIKRVHEVLSTVHVYGKDADVASIFRPKKVWKKKAPKPLAQANPETGTTGTSMEEEEEEEESPPAQLETLELTLGTLDLREHEIYPQRRRRRRRKEGRRKGGEGSPGREVDVQGEPLEPSPAEESHGRERRVKSRGKRKPQSKTALLEEDGPDASAAEYGLRDALFTACKTGDPDALRSLLSLGEGKGGQGERAGPLLLLNSPIDSSGFTLLHVASAAGQRGVVQLLMDAGSDPACKDKKGQTPYGVAPEKDTRNMFRKYMADHPDKYDYGKAQIPEPLTAEEESRKAEKKRAQRAAKKQKEKELKEERMKEEQELEEKKRFLALSDREKRALAAEKRLAQQTASPGNTVSNSRRCWQCGVSLLGKVPFEYLNFSFCTPACVQAHRKANVAVARP